MSQRTTILTIALLCLLLAFALIASTALAQPLITCDEIWTFASKVSWYERDTPWTSEDWVRCAPTRWGARWDNAVCMHPTDHVYALRVLLEREPMMLEVEDSWHSGCSNIWLARCKTKQRRADGRPLDWDAIPSSSYMLEVLAYLAELRTQKCVTSITTAFDIFNGKKVDPQPEATAALYALWTGQPTPNPLCGNGRAETGETCSNCPQDLPANTCSESESGDGVGSPVPCPEGQACLPIVPECSRCPVPPRPTIAELLAAAPECSRWRAVVESAQAIARSPLTRQHRRQLVADCVKGLDREITRATQP